MLYKNILLKNVTDHFVTIEGGSSNSDTEDAESKIRMTEGDHSEKRPATSIKTAASREAVPYFRISPLPLNKKGVLFHLPYIIVSTLNTLTYILRIDCALQLCKIHIIEILLIL